MLWYQLFRLQRDQAHRKLSDGRGREVCSRNPTRRERTPCGEDTDWCPSPGTHRPGTECRDVRIVTCGGWGSYPSGFPLLHRHGQSIRQSRATRKQACRTGLVNRMRAAYNARPTGQQCSQRPQILMRGQVPQPDLARHSHSSSRQRDYTNRVPRTTSIIMVRFAITCSLYSQRPSFRQAGVRSIKPSPNSDDTTKKALPPQS